ncbi:hypothetical protein SNE40_002257 [Patella caerulea]|uniref:Uncharacterized protein n=1 Tax=Patella caerulea TaxID=87958 RepID=A0AAN8Q170_PATCE
MSKTLGSAIPVLKQQDLGLTIGVLSSLIILYIILAVMIYKPRRTNSQSSAQRLHDPLNYSRQYSSVENSINLSN